MKWPEASLPAISDTELQLEREFKGKGRTLSFPFRVDRNISAHMYSHLVSDKEPEASPRHVDTVCIFRTLKFTKDLTDLILTNTDPTVFNVHKNLSDTFSKI